MGQVCASGIIDVVGSPFTLMQQQRSIIWWYTSNIASYLNKRCYDIVKHVGLAGVSTFGHLNLLSKRKYGGCLCFIKG